MKKRIALFLAVVLVVSAFAGCGGADPEPTSKEMVLNWNLGADFKTIDPQLNSASNGGHVINNMYDGLTREVDGELQLAVADSYTISEDELTYTFILKDTKWSDGSPVIADDFVYAWKRACDPNLDPEPSEYAFQLFYIQGAQAVPILPKQRRLQTSEMGDDAGGGEEGRKGTRKSGSRGTRSRVPVGKEHKGGWSPRANRVFLC